jgi:hypothetical protein
MTEQEKFEKLFFEYHQAAMAFMDANDKKSTDKNESQEMITDEEYENIKKRFDKASKEYHQFLGYS